MSTPRDEGRITLRIALLTTVVPILVWASMHIHWFLDQATLPVNVTIVGVTDYTWSDKYDSNGYFSIDDVCMFCKYLVKCQFQLNQTKIETTFTDSRVYHLGEKELRYYNVDHPTATYARPPTFTEMGSWGIVLWVLILSVLNILMLIIGLIRYMCVRRDYHHPPSEEGDVELQAV